MQINASASDKKEALSKTSFYHQSTISLYSWFLSDLFCKIFLMKFHGSIFLNIKLRPTTTSSPRKRGRGLHNPDSSHDQIRCFWLAEVRNFTNIMIELTTDSTKPLPKPIWITHQRGLVRFNWGEFHGKCWSYQYKELTCTGWIFAYVNILVIELVSFVDTIGIYLMQQKYLFRHGISKLNITYVVLDLMEIWWHH